MAIGPRNHNEIQHCRGDEYDQPSRFSLAGVSDAKRLTVRRPTGPGSARQLPMSSRAGSRLTGSAAMTTSGDTPTFNDRTLLDRARAGDQRAFGELLDHHWAGLYALCGLMLGDPEVARRVLSEVVVVAWRERNRVTPVGDPRAWLYRTALRMCGEAEPSAMNIGEEIGFR